MWVWVLIVIVIRGGGYKGIRVIMGIKFNFFKWEIVGIFKIILEFNIG